MKIGDKVICIDDTPNTPIPIGKKFGITKNEIYKIEGIKGDIVEISKKVKVRKKGGIRNCTVYGEYKRDRFLTIQEYRKQKLLKLNKA